MKILLALCLLIYTQVNAQKKCANAKKKCAFVVTIANYEHWTKLNSDSDKVLINRLLKRQNFDTVINVSESMVVKDSLSAKLNHFINHIIEKDDIVYFHYSGHGTRLPDKNNDEADTFDEALVLYNAISSDSLIKSNNQEDYLLVDDEIEVYFDRIRNKIGHKGHLVAVFDACHSGTVSRDGDRVIRSADSGYRNISKSDTAYNLNIISKQPQTDTKKGKLICYFACKPYQENAQLTNAGSLTFFFCAAINECTKPTPTYSDIFDVVNFKYSQELRNHQQTPWIEGDSLNQKLFSGEFIIQPNDYAVNSKENGNILFIDGGGIHGLCSGDSIHITGINDNKDIIKYKGKIIETGLILSKAQINETEDITEAPKGLRAIVVSRAISATDLLKIYIDPKDTNQLISLLPPNITCVNDSNRARYFIKSFDGNDKGKNSSLFQILIKNEDTILPLRGMGNIKLTNDNINSFKDTLKQLFISASRAEIIRNLEDSKTDSIEVIIYSNNEQQQEKKVVSLTGLNANDSIELKFSFTFGTDKYASLIAIEPDNSIFVEKCTPIKKDSISYILKEFTNYGVHNAILVCTSESIDLSELAKLNSSLISRDDENNFKKIIDELSNGSRSSGVLDGDVIIKNIIVRIEKPKKNKT